MYLKRLEIRGFKSFASATTFHLEPGVSAIVGPNGSGKSNVVDALAWVMGEQGARALRGGSMEDVIFAGTSSRPALGRAQVSLTIDNSDGVLPIEYSEVTITRTLFRSGASEYAINNSACRLLDIQELLSDTGMGRQMHVIVGQGQLDRVLQATPAERRGFIEEAAGVVKFRRRKEKTERKLSAVEANLLRLEDLVQEVGKQLSPLGRQAKTAARAQQVQADVRDSRARLLADETNTVLQRYREAETRLSEVKARLAQAEEEWQRQQAEDEVLNRELDAAREELAALTEYHYQYAAGAERAAAVAELARERASTARQRRDEAIQRVGSAGGRQAGEKLRAEQLAEVEAEITAAELRVQQLRDDCASAAEADRAAAAAVEEENRRIQQAAASYRQAQEDYLHLVAEVEVAATRVAHSSQHWEQAKAQLAEEQADDEAGAAGQAARHSGDDAGADRADGNASGGAAAGGDTATLSLAAAEAAAEAAASSLAAAQGKHRRAERLYRHCTQLAERAQAAQVRAEVQAETLATQWQRSRTPDHAPGAELSSLVVISPGWELAAAALFQIRHHPVVASVNEIGEYLRNHEAPGTGLDIRYAAAQNTTVAVPAPDTSTAQLAAGAVPASEIISVAAGASEAQRAYIQRLCESAVCVPELDFEVAHKYFIPQGLNVVDRRGALVSAERYFYQPESTQEALTLGRRHRQAQETLAQATEHSQHATTRQQQAQTLLQVAAEALEAAQAEATTTRAQAQTIARTLAAQAEERRRHREAEQRRHQATQRRCAEAEKQYWNHQKQHQQLAEKLQHHHAPVWEEPDQQQQQALKDHAQAASSEHTQAQLHLRAAEAELGQLQRRAQAVKTELQDYRRRLDQARNAALTAQAQLRHSSTIADEAQQLQQNLNQAHQQLGQQISAGQEALKELAAHHHTQRQRLQEAGTEIEQLRHQSHTQELTTRENEIQLAQLTRTLREELGMTVDYALSNYGPDQPIALHEDPAVDRWARQRYTTDEHGQEVAPYCYFDREEQTRRYQRALKDLKALGKVNPLALEEYQALKERFEYLQEQLEDVRQSKKDLQQLISEVDGHVQRVFAAAMTDTAREFEKIFARLFPGGQGKLVLEEQPHSDEPGVEVEAKPAGKKIKRLSLLSGGERSLTALALLIAIFIARPSPFYVLDEVEAALDDVNLGRLLEIFKDLQKESQLVIITHQKRTMEIADALYGVSMRQDGISQVISQRVERSKGQQKPTP